MKATVIEHPVTIWMTNDIPSRMVYAGQRWRVTDVPTRLRGSIWEVEPGHHGSLYGWRFQGTNDAGESMVFDVFKAEDGWHFHRAYT